MNVLEKILEEIDKIKDVIKAPIYDNCFGDECGDNGDCMVCVCEKIMDIIRSHMDDVENDGWISVSERLPEENGYYLITVKKLNYEEHVTISFFDKYDMRGWQHVRMLTEKVTAWKSLPEPYKGE